jgi:hypothetical protein
MNNRKTTYTRIEKLPEEVYLEAQKRAYALPFFDYHIE